MLQTDVPTPPPQHQAGDASVAGASVAGVGSQGRSSSEVGPYPHSTWPPLPSQGLLGPGEETIWRTKLWQRRLDPQQDQGPCYGQPSRAGTKGPPSATPGVGSVGPAIHTPAREGISGLAPLTTCLRPGWSCRWGPQRVRSATRPSSHHCRASGAGQEPVLTQQAPGAGGLTSCPMSSTIHPAAEV